MAEARDAGTQEDGVLGVAAISWREDAIEASRDKKPNGLGVRKFRIIAVLLATVFVVFSVFLASRKTASTQTASSPLLFKVAPQLEGPMLSGQRVTLLDLRGKFVLVNFFASWCSTCKTEMPQLLAFSKSEARKVVILGVDYDDQNASAKSFMSSYGAKWPVIVDKSGQRALMWGVSQPPESFLVAPDGKVLTRIVGPTTSKQLSNLVSLAIAKGY